MDMAPYQSFTLSPYALNQRFVSFGLLRRTTVSGANRPSKVGVTFFNEFLVRQPHRTI
ncbi:hypothetical protein [Corynebacterium glutamicum]|uniref:hypothetical protein n=1 Tax=Corynebacterium glutamicum TaxID=1718 RepID=UPI00039B2F96|nr:hypothetical protein [Corynebacterium glutamicum]